MRRIRGSKSAFIDGLVEKQKVEMESKFSRPHYL
ncbi:hypothetical protein V512_007955 [Mesotoga sp. Brook.08.105.5.1]|nr:hypothetical protein V512_007955 [Mesotoga sp. Brook.08.105.5.1]RAO97291.1 hypothetical protein M388_00565 [Mesotoga sp. Brook.08.YT.4.2.5.4.]